MEVTGRLIQVLPLQTGQGKNGEWRKQDIILETEENPPKKLCIGFWNDKINSDLIEGSTLKVSFEIDSREYNEKWFTNLRGWKLEELSSIAGTINPANENLSTGISNKNKDFPDFDSDLPFDNEVLPF